MNSDWFVVKNSFGNLLYCGESWEQAKDAYSKSKFGRHIVNNRTLYKTTELTESQKEELKNL